MLYPKQNIIKLGKYYTNHVLAMTVEGLHSKSDIAAQLAWRDKRIDELTEAARRMVNAFDVNCCTAGRSRDALAAIVDAK